MDAIEDIFPSGLFPSGLAYWRYADSSLMERGRWSKTIGDGSGKMPSSPREATREKLRMPMTSDSPDLKHGSGHRNLNHRDEGHGGHDRRGRVHHDAQRTMIGVAAFLMAMRNLRDSQQRQQNRQTRATAAKARGFLRPLP